MFPLVSSIWKSLCLDHDSLFQILNRTNNIFELVTVEPILNDNKPPSDGRGDLLLSDEMEISEDKNLRLKGNMHTNYIIIIYT